MPDVYRAVTYGPASWNLAPFNLTSQCHQRHINIATACHRHIIPHSTPHSPDSVHRNHGHRHTFLSTGHPAHTLPDSAPCAPPRTKSARALIWPLAHGGHLSGCPCPPAAILYRKPPRRAEPRYGAGRRPRCPAGPRRGDFKSPGRCRRRRGGGHRIAPGLGDRRVGNRTVGLPWERG